MIKRIPTTIYGCEWYIVVNEPIDRLRAHCEKRYGKEYLLKGFETQWQDGGMWNVVGNGGYIVMRDEWKYEVGNTACLSHECLHAAIGTLFDIGFIVDRPENDEPLTYLHQYYFQQCMGLIGREIPYPESS